MMSATFMVAFLLL